MRALNPFTRGYAGAFARLKLAGTTTAKKIGRTCTSLMETNVLPSSEDFEAPMPPVGKAWVRQVPGTALWLWYTFTDDTVTLRALTTAPPEI